MLRFYQPFFFDEWQLTLREDITGVRHHQTGADHPMGAWPAHFGAGYADQPMVHPISHVGESVGLIKDNSQYNNIVYGRVAFRF